MPLVAYSVFDLIRFQKKTQDEVSQFVESIHYRDFSRHFDVRKAPNGLKPLRKGFNEINTTFKLISRERETQYHYLQKILELVDTGILSYEQETGETGWLNEAFKNLMGIPYLKTIHSLEKREEVLYKELIKLKTGDAKILTVNRNGQLVKILVTASMLRSDDKVYKLIAFQNVGEALDETESKSLAKAAERNDTPDHELGSAHIFPCRHDEKQAKKPGDRKYRPWRAIGRPGTRHRYH